MRTNTRTFAVLGIAVGLAACSGSPFGADDEKPAEPNGGGTSSGSGKSGAGSSAAGEGGDASATGGDGVGANVSGGSSASGGAGAMGGFPPSEGGAAPGAAGSDDGAAGEDSGPVAPVFTVSKLIDDMEDGNQTLLGSNGDWFVFKDASNGTITPAKGQTFTMSALVPARGASTKAAAVTVAGFTGWGAAFGFDFSYAGGVRQQTELKEALAVRFWAKASKATSVRLQLPNIDTDPLGGKCSGTGDNACNAHWTKPFAVGTAWKETTILFSELKQDLPGRHVPSFDKQHVYSAFFILGPNQAVTVWVDDIALVH